MANEKEADLAREQHSDFLQKLGAHGITIDAVKKKGEEFAVIAFFERKPDELPTTLEIKRGNVTRKVPLIARVMEKFKPE
jgi:hypothetical protein